MKKLVFILFHIICFQGLSQSRGSGTTSNSSIKYESTPTYLANTVIVKFRTSLRQFDENTPEANRSFGKYLPFKISSFKKKFRTVGKEFNSVLDNIYEIRYEGTASVQHVIREISKDSDVVYAEPNYIYHPLYNPNDPSFANNKQTYLDQIKAIQGWEVVRNASDIIIAIIDSGTDLKHEDLQDNLYLNERDPINGIDDDHDGFIDNYYGWDFVGEKTNFILQDNDPQVGSNKSNHGIHVSGIASAVTNNNKGIASVAGNAKLMIVKVAPDEEADNILKGYEGIKYAVDHGAKIINCSWGGIAESNFGRDIINYAVSKGCLVIAAAGNSNKSEPIYPAAYKGVLAVANVQDNDVKHEASSFGYYVSISAPGTNIFSTFYGDQYGNLSGTSMAAPLVSSAAALVKSYFPDYSMVQVAEQLRVTADNIDVKNPGYAGQLGKGRLNIYEALTKKLPSVRSEITLNKDYLFPGDTILVYADAKNYLAATQNLSVALNAGSPYLKVLNESIFVGKLSTLESRSLERPFKVLILETTPVNSTITLQFNYQDTDLGYSDFQNFILKVNLDYLNVEVNEISTTMTANGRIGYSEPNAKHGLGFRYKGKNLLYEASLMVGNSPGRVSNNASSELGTSEDFVRVTAATRITDINQPFEGYSAFSDAGSSRPLNILVKHRQLAYNTMPGENYLIAEYKIINNNNFGLDGIYIGLFTDWDIATNALDVTGFDPLLKLAYASGKSDKSIYAGVKLLSARGSPVYYPLSKKIEGNPLSNGFTVADKYKCLSAGIHSLGLGDAFPEGLDVSFVSGYGPFRILPQDSITVAFAFIAADDNMDLQNSAKQAQNKYDLLFPENGYRPDQVTLSQNYPNPFSEHTFIDFSIPENGKVKVELFALTGVRVHSIMDMNLSPGSYTVKLDRKNIPAGVYVYTLQFNGVRKSNKLIFVK